MPVNPDLLLLIPLAFTLYAFVRLAVDQQVVWQHYDRLKREYPVVVEQLGQPVSMFNAWKWMLGKDPDWLFERPDLMESYREIQWRLRAWNFHTVPIAAALWLVFGALREFLRR